MPTKPPTITTAKTHEPTRTGLAADALKQAVLDNLVYTLARLPEIATSHDWYMALARSVRDRMLARWISTVRGLRRARCKNRLLLVGRVPDGPAARQQPDQPRHRGGRARGDALARPRPRRAARATKKSRGWATAASDASRPATWIRSPRSRCRRSATASATSSASSTRRSATAGRSRSPTSGCDGNPWEIARPEMTVDVKFGGHTELGRIASRALSRALGPGGQGQGRALRHAGARLPRQHLQHPASVESRGGRSPSTSRHFNVGDYYGAVEQKTSPRRSPRCSTRTTSRSSGKQLRLAQQYFFVSCSLQDMLRLLACGRASSSASPRSSRCN